MECLHRSEQRYLCYCGFRLGTVSYEEMENEAVGAAEVEVVAEVETDVQERGGGMGKGVRTETAAAAGT